MRYLFALLLLAASCTPYMTERMQLMHDTAAYTACDHVEVECVDENCSNVAGGPWFAMACGTRYRCTRTAGQVVCAPVPK